MDTKGWDSICISSIDTINERLNKQMNIRQISFNFKSPKIQFTGEFDAWKIIKGGTEKFLHIETPIKHGTFKILESGKSFDLKSICPVMEVQLVFMNLEETNNYINNLEFNFNEVGKEVGDPSIGVTIIDINYTEEHSIPSPIKTLLKSHLPELFINNKNQFLFTLGQVDSAPPFKYEDTGCTPIFFLEYVYLPGENHETDYLAILSSYNKEFTPTPFNLELDTSILDAKYDTYFILSEGMFLQNMIKHQLPKIYTGSSVGDFIYEIDPSNSSSGSIVNTKDLNCPSVKWVLINYEPKITDLSLYIKNNKIVTDITGKCDLHGIGENYLTYTLNYESSIKYNDKLDTFSIIQDEKSIKSSHTVVLSGVMKIGALYWGPLVELIVYSIIKLVTDAVGDSVGESTKRTITESFRNTANIPFIIKREGDNFQVKNVELDQTFCVKGIRKINVKA